MPLPFSVRAWILGLLKSMSSSGSFADLVQFYSWRLLAQPHHDGEIFHDAFLFTILHPLCAQAEILPQAECAHPFLGANG